MGRRSGNWRIAAEKIVEMVQSPESGSIIMGSYGHSRIREAILGSTTVSGHAQCLPVPGVDGADNQIIIRISFKFI